jgi:hypothetical protein
MTNSISKYVLRCIIAIPELRFQVGDFLNITPLGVWATDSIQKAYWFSHPQAAVSYIQGIENYTNCFEVKNVILTGSFLVP